MPLDGKIALVTGSSRDIGKAIALKLAGEGANIIVTYYRSDKLAQETAEEIRAKGVEAEVIGVDVGDRDEIKEMFGKVEERFGSLDILVNNAATGLQRPRPASKQMPKHLKRTMNVNLFGPWFAAQEAVKLMKGRGGRIVNLTSLGSRVAYPRYSAVGVSKGALETLTIYLASELAPEGILVNAVCGGVVRDTLAVRLFEDQIETTREHVPAGRHVAPEDMANAVAFLCSDDAAMICGQVLVVDGGFSLRGPMPEIS